MVKQVNTGKNPASKALREAERIAQLPPALQKAHPTAVRSNPEKLRHINTYGSLPEYYIDQPFTCRRCGKREIWMARDQKWFYEETKGHIDAIAVECHDCRKQRKCGGENQ
ncbi:MAG: zinc-ribbon domain containing protein [Pseudomonadales bacterium]